MLKKNTPWINCNGFLILAEKDITMRIQYKLCVYF